MISTKAIILAPIWGFALMIVGAFTAINGPDLEQQLSPVLVDQRVSNVTRTRDRLCWNWTYAKARDVTFIRNAYYAERDDGVRFPVSQFRPDLDIPTNDSTTAKMGVKRTIPECVTMPAALVRESRVSIQGVNTYKPWHGLWTLTQRVATVEVNALPRE